MVRQCGKATVRRCDGATVRQCGATSQHHPPQRARRLHNHLIHIIRQSLNQLPHDVPPLKQPPRGRVVLDEVTDCRTGPGAVCVFG